MCNFVSDNKAKCVPRGAPRSSRAACCGAARPHVSFPANPARRGRRPPGRARAVYRPPGPPPPRREKEIGGSGGSLEPPGPLPTHLHTVYMEYSECVPTLVNPLAKRTCFSQVRECWRRTGGFRGQLKRAVCPEKMAIDLLAAQSSHHQRLWRGIL